VPEGHSIRIHARKFASTFGGEKVTVWSPQGRFAAGAALLDGQVLQKADAKGKHLFLGFDNQRWLHVHLGLYGKWAFRATPALPPVGQVRVRIESADFYADLRGATACEVMTRPEVRDTMARLGPDPLRRDGDRDEFFRRVRTRRRTIAELLMDQAVIAGVGNVYRAEVLFRARLSPDILGNALDEDTVGALWDDLSTLQRDGVKRGTIVTTVPADRPPGARRGRPPRSAAHYVYRRAGEPCRICGTPVATRVVAARNLFWCPVCQAG
jgi:DNA-formamidopyrimidine glycosylase